MYGCQYSWHETTQRATGATIRLGVSALAALLPGCGRLPGAISAPRWRHWVVGYRSLHVDLRSAPSLYRSFSDDKTYSSRS